MSATRELGRWAVPALVLASCTASTTWTAQRSIQPVLLGPVHRIGGQPNEVDGRALASFHSACVTSDGEDGSWRASRRSLAGRADWDVLRRTGDARDRRVVVESLDCSGFSVWMGFWLMRARCTVGGTVFDSR